MPLFFRNRGRGKQCRNFLQNCQISLDFIFKFSMYIMFSVRIWNPEIFSWLHIIFFYSKRIYCRIYVQSINVLKNNFEYIYKKMVLFCVWTFCKGFYYKYSQIIILKVTALGDQAFLDHFCILMTPGGYTKKWHYCTKMCIINPQNWSNSSRLKIL